MKPVSLETVFNLNDLQMKRISYRTSLNQNAFQIKRVSLEPSSIVTIFKKNKFQM